MQRFSLEAGILDATGIRELRGSMCSPTMHSLLSMSLLRRCSYKTWDAMSLTTMCSSTLQFVCGDAAERFGARRDHLQCAHQQVTFLSHRCSCETWGPMCSPAQRSSSFESVCINAAKRLRIQGVILRCADQAWSSIFSSALTPQCVGPFP